MSKQMKKLTIGFILILTALTVWFAYEAYKASRQRDQRKKMKLYTLLASVAGVIGILVTVKVFLFDPLEFKRAVDKMIDHNDDSGCPLIFEKSQSIFEKHVTPFSKQALCRVAAQQAWQTRNNKKLSELSRGDNLPPHFWLKDDEVGHIPEEIYTTHMEIGMPGRKVHRVNKQYFRK